MSRVADYSIVQDGPLTVKTDVQSRKFNVPPNLHEGSRGILSFVVTKLEDVEEALDKSPAAPPIERGHFSSALRGPQTALFGLNGFPISADWFS